METRTILFGETALDLLAQWLREQGVPRTLDDVLQKYLEILRDIALRETEQA